MQLSTNRRRDPAQVGIRLLVDAVAMQKLWAWTDVAHGEVSMLGLVDEIRDADNGAVTALLVTDMYLVKQHCSIDETTMDPQAVAQLMVDLEGKGIDPRKLRCWAHSHASMSVFWSGTDDQTVDGLANGDYLLSLVVNKKHDTMMRLDQYHPAHLYLTDIAFEISYPTVDGLAAACLAEFKAKVTETSFVMSQGRFPIAESMQDLKEAHERGALTTDELRDELDWLGIERDDYEEQPF
jgi:hypothetical protein